MATKTLNYPVSWKRFTSNAIESYKGVPAEPIVDMRQAVPQVRLCDGVTPGGHIVGGGEAGTPAGIVTPQVVSPLDGATGVSSQPMITGSAFSGLKEDGSADILAAMFVEIATDDGFTNIVHSSGRFVTSSPVYDMETAGASIDYGESVKVRIKYEGESGTQSEWSFATGFTVFFAQVGATIDGDIVAADLGSEWLLVAPASKRTKKRWGLYNIPVDLPDRPTPDINTGEYNTDVLTRPEYSSINDNQGSIGAPAAQYCRDLGYDLPNREELIAIYNNRAAIASVDTSSGYDFSDMESEYINAWSSTRYLDYGAATVSFGNGATDTSINRYHEFAVIPVRRIPKTGVYEGATLPDGGIVAGVMGSDWIVVAPATKRQVKQFGLEGASVYLTSAIGKENTDILMSPEWNNHTDSKGTVGSPAAQFARGHGYDLPSYEELVFVAQNRAAIDAADDSGGTYTLSYIATDPAPIYRKDSVSSSYAPGNYVKGWDFRWDKPSTDFPRIMTNWVIPVRRIPV